MFNSATIQVQRWKREKPDPLLEKLNETCTNISYHSIQTNFLERSEDFSLIMSDQVFIAANNESGKTKSTLHIPMTRSYNIHKEKPNNSLLNFWI